jgi:type II secretory pathway pseudopilin PulG
MSTTATTKETVMGQVIPRQHPAVVLKSHYKAIRALLAVALVAIVALAATVVILASDDDNATTSAQPQAQAQAQQLPAGTRFDGGPDEGTRGIQAEAPAPGTRFDGGPDEGTRGIQSYWQQSNPRTSYQPAPDEGFKERAGGPQFIPMGPGGR